MHIILKPFKLFFNTFNTNDCIIDGFIIVFDILSEAFYIKTHSVKRGLHVLSDIRLVIIH
jgi:hypothetical protein